MRESDYYPAGSYSDPSAPWNQCDPPEIELEVTVYETLRKDDSIITDNAWYVYDEEGSRFLEDSNLDSREEWEKQNGRLETVILKAKDEIIRLREDAERQQRQLEAHYGVRHNTIPGYHNPDAFEIKRRQLLWNAMQRVKYLKQLETALSGWESEEFDVNH